MKDVGLPQPNDVPTLLSEASIVATVPEHIGPDLLDPVRRIRPDLEVDRQAPPLSAMPEVAVAKHSDSLPPEHDVRPARQSAVVFVESKSKLPE